MITMARAVDISKMKEVRDSYFNHELTKGYDAVLIISMTNTGEKDPVFREGFSCAATSTGTIVIWSLQVDDMNPNSPRLLISAAGGKEMTYKQAKDIVTFIIESHASKKNYLLLTNCHMGISRSGAVARFTQQLCGIDPVKFDRLNRQIGPNLWIFQMLHHAWNLEFEKDSRYRAIAWEPQNSTPSMEEF